MHQPAPLGSTRSKGVSHDEGDEFLCSTRPSRAGTSSVKARTSPDAPHQAELTEHAPPYDDDASEAEDETDSESVRPPPERADD